tara:strand:+ start:364 stop:879 length:516 start_codon:yes stop_codon:yes gene_type:complete
MELFGSITLEQFFAAIIFLYLGIRGFRALFGGKGHLGKKIFAGVTTIVIVIAMLLLSTGSGLSEIDYAELNQDEIEVWFVYGGFYEIDLLSVTATIDGEVHSCAFEDLSQTCSFTVDHSVSNSDDPWDEFWDDVETMYVDVQSTQRNPAVSLNIEYDGEVFPGSNRVIYLT